MSAQTDFDAALSRVTQLSNDLAKWLGTLANDLKRLGDPRSQRAAEMSGGCAKSASHLGAGIVDLYSIVNILINTSPGGTLHYGFIDDFSFAGGTAGEASTKTVTGQAWVVAAMSRIVVFSNSPPRTSAVEYYSVAVSNLVDATGFDVTMTASNASTPAGSDYSAFWLSFG